MYLKLLHACHDDLQTRYLYLVQQLLDLFVLDLYLYLSDKRHLIFHLRDLYYSPYLPNL